MVKKRRPWLPALLAARSIGRLFCFTDQTSCRLRQRHLCVFRYGGGCRSSQKALNRLPEFLDRMAVAILHRMDETMRDVLVDDHLAEAPHGGIDCGQMNENIRAVLIIFNHILHLLEMADDPGEPVQHLFLVLRGVVVPVHMRELFFFLQVFMRMVCHFLLLLGKDNAAGISTS